MSRWRSHKAYSNLSGELQETVGREFEKAALPLLKIIWSDLTRPPELGAWDRKGVDLLSRSDDDHLDVVIQCKGYEVSRPGTPQLKEAKKSISKFRDSNQKAKHYVLLYNRPSSNRKFHLELESKAIDLINSKVVERAEVWDLQTFLDEVFNSMAERIDKYLIQSANELLSRFEKLSDLSFPFVDRVPIRESELIFKRYEPCKKHETKPLAIKNSQTLLLDEGDYRWTLLAGLFGAGKTTAALQAATHAGAERIPIFVQAKALTASKLLSGTNVLLSQVLRSLRLYEKLEVDDIDSSENGPMLENLAGSILGKLLRNSDSKYIFILDGLDENRVYCSSKGIECLNNQLAEFRCPVVMTTRKELLSDQFGHFTTDWPEASMKYGPNRKARLLEMEKWEPDIIRGLVKSLLESSNQIPKKKSRLKQFANILDTKDYVKFYGELPTNPLFLSFILEDVVDTGVRVSSRSEIVHRWVKRKIFRDRSISVRISPDDDLDVIFLCSYVFEVLRECAGDMIEESDSGPLLTESLNERRVSDIATRIFRKSTNSILPLLLNSVLVPLGYRDDNGLKVGFVYQMLQEFFLAKYLVHNEIESNCYPSSVVDFCKELKKEKTQQRSSY